MMMMTMMRKTIVSMKTAIMSMTRDNDYVAIVVVDDYGYDVKRFGHA